jgi:hypothetical protein
MIILGPVAEAARGGHGNPFFDLLAGSSVLALTWIGYTKKTQVKKVNISVALAISAICGIFIYFGIVELLR